MEKGRINKLSLYLLVCACWGKEICGKFNIFVLFVILASIKSHFDVSQVKRFSHMSTLCLCNITCHDMIAQINLAFMIWSRHADLCTMYDVTRWKVTITSHSPSLSKLGDCLKRKSLDNNAYFTKGQIAHKLTQINKHPSEFWLIFVQSFPQILISN